MGRIIDLNCSDDANMMVSTSLDNSIALYDLATRLPIYINIGKNKALGARFVD